ncbi:hypothetical protein L596_021982 [Steinernema carpocapsae]|uniref:Uncharacterized protein n=1 Tax=Steinernema carpocapsae TaxID=34508 RepID=A0A4U5MKE9_STECR|nr:hypothetical protein L596_021982 [Steinernema carpocapsae]
MGGRQHEVFKRLLKLNLFFNSTTEEVLFCVRDHGKINIQSDVDLFYNIQISSTERLCDQNAVLLGRSLKSSAHAVEIFFESRNLEIPTAISALLENARRVRSVTSYYSFPYAAQVLVERDIRYGTLEKAVLYKISVDKEFSALLTNWIQSGRFDYLVLNILEESLVHPEEVIRMLFEKACELENKQKLFEVEASQKHTKEYPALNIVYDVGFDDLIRLRRV